MRACVRVRVCAWHAWHECDCQRRTIFVQEELENKLVHLVPLVASLIIRLIRLRKTHLLSSAFPVFVASLSWSIGHV
eukprot:COSAG06_NODE_37777_length_431_cov_0.834337_2_plen_76_part_01